jgi:uncharacterized protein involved in exopolysaccharide biosynthesis
MNERTTHPLEYLAMLRRHTAWIVSIFILCVTIGVALALFLPTTYMSGATIAVESPAVSPDLVAGRSSRARRCSLVSPARNSCSPIGLSSR